MTENLKNEEAWKPEPAESFLIDFLNAQGPEAIRGLSEMGFRFLEAKHEGEDKVVIIGERQNGDGTKIEVTITRGEKYKSPKELADLEAEAKAKAEKNKK
jgi:hypothetical protein